MKGIMKFLSIFKTSNGNIRGNHLACKHCSISSRCHRCEETSARKMKVSPPDITPGFKCYVLDGEEFKEVCVMTRNVQRKRAFVKFMGSNSKGKFAVQFKDLFV